LLESEDKGPLRGFVVLPPRLVDAAVSREPAILACSSTKLTVDVLARWGLA
jgi:hypothetical protein